MSPTPTDPPPPGATRPRRTRRAVWAAATIVVLAIVGLAGVHLADARRHLLAARTDLRAASEALSRHDHDAAVTILDRADSHLVAARRAARAFPLGVLGPIPVVGSPGRASADAAGAGMEAVASGRIVVTASASLPTSASVGVDGHDLTAFHDAATQSVLALADADHHLALAATALDGPAGAILPPLSGAARAMRTEVERRRSDLAGVINGLSLLEDLTAPDTDARLLLLSQDSLELRPTGGYIGSYGVIHFSHGTVQLEKYEATGDLPAPEPLAAPPAGLAGYLPSYWSLTNVNWWPDFPTTAAAAAEMFRRQAGGDVDGVLALTEAATARLIGAVGPLTLPSYAEPVVEAGFDRRVVQEVELKVPLDVPRKKFLIELSSVLFDHLFHLPADQVPKVTEAVRRSLGPADIQLWFKDPERQKRLAGTSVEGALPRTDGDFLMLVDANMGAGKANLDITKQVDYQVERDADGRLLGHLRVEISNRGEKTEINPLYSAYLRVYAPAGSHLVPSGPLQAQQAAADGPFEVFSQPLIVMPKSMGSVTFTYVLPDRIAAQDQYRLTWLRQVGTANDQLRVVVEGQEAKADAATRTMEFADVEPPAGLVPWLRQRWVVRAVGLG